MSEDADKDAHRRAIRAGLARAKADAEAQGRPWKPQAGRPVGIKNGSRNGYERPAVMPDNPADVAAWRTERAFVKRRRGQGGGWQNIANMLGKALADVKRDHGDINGPRASDAPPDPTRPQSPGGCHMTDCQSCVALRRENGELLQELAIWRERGEAGPVLADQDQRIVALMRGMGVPRGEASALLHLMTHAGRTVSPEALLRAIRGAIAPRVDVDDIDARRHANVYVCRLRKALKACAAPDAIRTVWGVGYDMTPPMARTIAVHCGIGDGPDAPGGGA